MPKIVDHAARRRELAEALWTVVRSAGVDKVSVRTVAAAAGTSPGALRHYFASQEELAAFSLQTVVDSVTTRLLRIVPGLDDEQAGMAILEEYLPLDRERRDGMAVYLAFLGRPNPGGRLHRIRELAETRSREGVQFAVARLAAAGRIHPGRDLLTEADALYPFIDGLAMHGTLWPERYPPDQVRALLHRQIATLASPP